MPQYEIKKLNNRTKKQLINLIEKLPNAPPRYTYSLKSRKDIYKLYAELIKKINEEEEENDNLQEKRKDIKIISRSSYSRSRIIRDIKKYKLPIKHSKIKSVNELYDLYFQEINRYKGVEQYEYEFNIRYQYHILYYRWYNDIDEPEESVNDKGESIYIYKISDNTYTIKKMITHEL